MSRCPARATSTRRKRPGRRFVNLKACFYQELADALERDQIEGLTDETTIGQLAGLLMNLIRMAG